MSKPGFTARYAYNAANVLIGALRQNCFSGGHKLIRFEAFGDSNIAMQKMIVRDGHFRPVVEC
jgi:hypothetical protein